MNIRLSIVTILSVAVFIITGQMMPPGPPEWAPPGIGPCANEISDGPCYWDAEYDGNGGGQSFWVDSRNMIHPR